MLIQRTGDGGKVKSMKTKHLTTKINELIEDIYMLFEKKERSYMTHRLNNQQHILLTLLMRESNLSPSDLAESLDITKSAISQQLKILEEIGRASRSEKQYM